MINDIIKNIAAQMGLDEGIATKGVGIVMAMLQKFGDVGALSQLFEKIPGAGELAQSSISDLETGGGGLMSMVGGLLGGGAGDAAKALEALKGLGLDMDQGKQLTSLVGSAIKDNAGADVLDAVLGDKAGWLKELL